MADSKKRKGMPSVLAFILGLLLGIILIVGAIAAAVLIALNYKFDNIKANKDGDGNYIYINADPDNGGVENALALISKVREMAEKGMSLSIGDIELVLPVTEKLTDAVFNALGSYVDIDRDELKSTAFSDLGPYVQELVMEMRVSALCEKAGVSGVSDSLLMTAILYGLEAECTEYNGLKYPVWYDKYVEQDGQYVRQSDGEPLPEDRIDYLEPFAEYYRLYFYEYNVTSDGVVYDKFVTYRNEDGDFVFTAADLSIENIEKYYYECGSDSNASGNYYYDNDGNKVEFNPVTVRYLVEGNTQKTLDNMPVTDIIDNPDDLTEKLVGGITVGDLFGGVADFSDILDKLLVSDIMDIEPTSPIMSYIGYGLYGMTAGEDGLYYGSITFKEGEETIVRRCTVVTEEKDGKIIISRVYYTEVDAESGEEIETDVESTRVSALTDRINGITEELAISDIIDIKVPTDEDNNAIMIFLAYGVTDVEKEENSENLYSGLYYGTDAEGNELPAQKCYLVSDGQKFVSAYLEDGTPIYGTSIKGVSDQMSRLTKTLKLKDIVEIDDSNTVLAAIKNSTIEGLPAAVNSLTVNELYYETIYANQEQEQRDEDGIIVKDENGEALMVDDASREHTLLYVALGNTQAQFELVYNYNPLFIYYTFDNGVYSLATTTGKLAESVFEAGKYYSLGGTDVNNDSVLDKDDEYYILFDETFLYYEYDGDGYSLVGKDGEGQIIGRLGESEFESHKYYTYGSPNALWKILLMVDETTEDGEARRYENAYTVNNLTDMISNVTSNTKYSTMRELHEAGLMKFEDPNELDIKVGETEEGDDICVGDLQLTELVSKFIGLVKTGGMSGD